ncbi:MAG: hypothetical protein AB7O96_01935 [Pseudobdellovibrionaceae bacterium]
MKKLVVVLAISMLGSMASAANGPLWGCKLKANLGGHETGLVLSIKKLAGPGFLDCVTLDGSQQMAVPVNVRITGYGAGVGFSKTKNIEMLGVGLGAVHNPVSFANSYKMGVSAGAALIRAGFGFDAAFTAGRQGGGLEVGLSGKDVRGLFVGLHFQKMTISLRK